MVSSRTRLWVIAVALAGCQTDQQFLDSMQPMAVQTAVNRARFDMNCPEANGTMLSREITQPPLEGPRMYGGVSRAEYTIGVAGCGQRSTLVVICPAGGDGCFAAEGREQRRP